MTDTFCILCEYFFNSSRLHLYNQLHIHHSLPTDVQNEAVPLILGGGDVLMAAETGSGKTGAFCLPILQIVWETLKDIQLGKTSKSVGKEVCE